jgi:hypothetical protein
MATSVRPAAATADAPPSREPGRIRRIARSGWWPAGLLLATTVGALAVYGVSFGAMAAFAVYIVLGIGLPGLLVWRWVRGRAGCLPEDAGAGLAVGYALEVLAYVPARAVGLPRLTLVVPVAILVAFTAGPGLRRCWRGGERAPALWSWSVTAVLLALLGSTCGQVYRQHFLQWPNIAAGTSEMPFHLALAGELKHHVPPAIPYALGEPLYYHWFVYADLAATSWATGIELQTLLFRLSVLPMVAALVLVIAALARRLSGAWWTGPAAAVVTFFVLAPDPYRWPLPPFFTGYLGFGAVEDGSLLRPSLWSSPTQTFGAVLFAPVVFLLAELFTGFSRRRVALFAVLLVAVMGGKATFLPILLAALLITAFVHLVVRRRFFTPALITAGLTVPVLLFAQLVLYGGATQGLRLQPLATMKSWAMSQATGFATQPSPPAWRLVVLCALFLAAWACIWGGAAGLGRRLTEPALTLLLALGVVGIGAITLLGHPGLSQGYFIQSVRPYLAVAAVCGVAVLVPRMSARTGGVLLGAVAAGVALVLGVRLLGSARVPGGSGRHIALELVWPYAAVALGAGLAGMLGWVLRGRLLAVALVAAVLTGSGLATGGQRLAYTTRTALTEGVRRAPVEAASIAPGAQEAGRWLRDHSAADDLVATNAHCLFPTGECSNQHVWIAAYTERQVLIEGWGFTDEVHTRAAALNRPEGAVPYWHPAVLNDNDAVFKAPSIATVARLRTRYRVKWLFVDERVGAAPGLGDYAMLRFRSGACAVYEI